MVREGQVSATGQDVDHPAQHRPAHRRALRVPARSPRTPGAGPGRVPVPRGLPHRHVDGSTLPFADGAFDAALCLEVLEHIDEPRAFLREIRRVAPKQLIVSVPNCELLGYLWDHLATPWHMLESTHVNFFTRWSLGTLLREFYPRVELRFYTPYPLPTIEGTPLHYNLLAIATAD